MDCSEIRKNIEHDELDPDDILIVLPNTYSAKSEYKELEKFLKANGINSYWQGWIRIEIHLE